MDGTSILKCASDVTAQKPETRAATAQAARIAGKEKKRAAELRKSQGKVGHSSNQSALAPLSWC